MERTTPPLVLDTFAGAGGFSLGFQLAGCSIIGAIERDAWAGETFAFNHPEAKVLITDIERLSDSDIVATFGSPGPSIVVGGPPCQGFSVCRRNAGDPNDPRNSLFEEFIRIGALLSPDLLVMENVPNLTKAKTASNEHVIDIICREFQSLGYSVDFEILEAVDFGIPQIRKRLFVVASKITLTSGFPSPSHSLDFGLGLFSPLAATPTLWEAISDLPILAAGEGADELEYDRPPENAYQSLLRGRSTRLFNHRAMRHSRRLVERFSAMKCGDSGSDVPGHLKPYVRNGSGLISGRVYDQNNRRMHPDRPCHTIPAAFYANFVHPFAHRNFTPREGARLQSFPDSYVFKGKPTVVSHKLLAREGRWDEKFLCQYNQIGNAVPPMMAKALASHLLDQIRRSDDPHVCARPKPVAERESSTEIHRPEVQAVLAGNS